MTKKTISKTFLGILSSLILIGLSFSFAQEDLGSWMDDLLSDMNFGYNSSVNISIDSITNDDITIKSNIVKGELDENITKYVAMYSEYSISTLIDDSSKLGDAQEKEFDINPSSGDTTFTVKLDADQDDIDRNKVYYVTLIPKDDFGTPGDISKEYCFLLNEKKYAEGDECDNLESTTTTSTDDTHNAAGPDMSLANITDTYNSSNGEVTLKWTALEGSDKIDLYLRNEDAERFEKLSTVNMNDEIYQFTIKTSGSHIIKFKPMDNGIPVGTEFNYTLNVQLDSNSNPNSTPKPNPGITKVPTVGPKENIMIIFLLSILGYFSYKKIYRKKHY